jgi:hypothetical protein
VFSLRLLCHFFRKRAASNCKDAAEKEDRNSFHEFGWFRVTVLAEFEIVLVHLRSIFTAYLLAKAGA